MIEMMLLGFLMDGEKTGYEIKKYMDNSTNFFFNTGFSSIYPKFKKLEKERCVRVSQKIKGGKLNKVYSLTDTGRKTFLDWLEIKPEIGRIRDEAMLKIFFFDYLEDGKVLVQLEEYIGDLREHIRTLRAIRERFSSCEIEPWKMTTLEFGIRYYRFLEQTFNEMLLEKC
jgi:DNA-binding PadR family transcriptional regulator